ncbi:MAG: glycosyltransferase [Stenomitos rutilans HA7619-LM2]|jgi:thioesterase domain-containing protein/ectoine hydroxylase-related dioxygenase (phytanoyl-CoA dioxygenase family)/glycosyltransferase involved in cell wall biosynthesis|nr:glycosyltransferase [Stenomitos rutilans HA7619-LM2]
MRNVFQSAALQQEFERNGYVIMPLLSAEEISLVLSELQLMTPDDNFNPDRLLDQPSYHLTDIDTNIEYKQTAKNFIAGVLAPYIERVFDDYKILGANFIVKPPGKGRFLVHHDWTFVADPKKHTSLTIWCPLIDTDESNGTLQVVESSHNIVSDIATSTVDFYCKNIESTIIEKYSKPLDLKAGNCVIFDQSLLHHSDINRTAQPRFVMQAIVVPTEINPVFYYFDRNSPEQGFEVFQIDPSFFIYADFSQRPANAKSLGFIENRNKYLTEKEFVEKMQKGQQSKEVVSKSLIPVKPNGCKRPFFYIHAADGHTVDAVLGKYIDTERPFYGIRAVGRDGQGILHTCIQETASHYIQEIQAVQPEGPYLLGGRCTGGNIALEMAQALKKQGQQVLLVVMVDSPKPLLTEEEKTEYPIALARDQIRWSGKLTSSDSDLSPTEIHFNPKVFEYNLQIPANHVPQAYLGRVAYFAAQEKSKDWFISNLLEPDAWNCWVANGVEIYEIPGDHLSMTKEPNVQVLAKELSHCLDQADREEQKPIEENLYLNSPIHLEIETKGYAVIDFLDQIEVLNLLDFYKKQSLPKDLAEFELAFSINSSDASYRKFVTHEIQKLFTSKLTSLTPDHRVAFCTFGRKKPNAVHSDMPLHQDPSVVDESLLKSFGLWCPLVDVNEQNGCLQVVPKSHLLNSKMRPLFVFNGFPYTKETLSIIQQQYLTAVPMKAGQALIYDRRLLHGSPSNLTNSERVAAIGILVPKDNPIHFCYRETQTLNKIEVFEVDDEFYNQYVVGRAGGQRPEGVKSLGVFDYEVEPLTPEILIKKLGAGNSALNIPDWTKCQISFKPEFLEKFNPSAQKIAVLISNEFEGFSKNGGIGTYTATLSQKLVADGWTVMLLLCQTDTEFQGDASFESVHHVFSTHEMAQILTLQPIHQQILSQTRQDDLANSFDHQSFCCLYFIQAIASTFPDAVIYAEFPEIWGFGYRTIQAKRSGLLGNSCLVGVTAHGSFEWLHEVNSRYRLEQPHWRSQAYHYEQFSYEHADITYSPSHFLKSKFSGYGWKTAHAKHLPYFVPSLTLQPFSSVSPLNPPILGDFGSCPPPNWGARGAKTAVTNDGQPAPRNETGCNQISIVFFGRLEERKGLCTFVEAVRLLDPAIAPQIHLTFIGKIIPLQSSQLEHLNSQQYIDRELGNAFTSTFLSDLSSQEAMQAIATLPHPIVCLTSLQENFPNTALEMGQLPVSLVVSDTGGFRETLALLQRSEAVHWFQPGNAHALAQALTQAIHAYPEKPTTIEQTAIDSTNHHLLNQRLEFMSQAFLEAAPKEPTTPSVTIALVCWHSATTLLECFTSLAAQTYEPLDVIVLSSATDASIQSAIVQAQTQFPSHKYLTAEAHWSLGEAYNHLLEQSSGEYILPFSPDQIATPNMVEKMIAAAHEANAVAVVCPQLVVAGEAPEAITTVDGNLLKLLEFNHQYDLTALFSKALLKEFRYAQERGLQALNWQIFAATIATDQAIAYYPYPLYAIRPDSASTIPTTKLAQERYSLRQYLFQIKPEQWSQRQINLLLTELGQLVQAPSPSQRQNWQPILPANQPSSPQDQAWMITAQQMHNELTQSQNRLKELEDWNRVLQAGKDWLESQWQAWMLRTQKAEVAGERSRSLIQAMQGSKFWKLRQTWIKIKRKLGKISADPLQPTDYTFTLGVQEFVARVAGQKIRFFKAAATQAPVVSIISSCFQEYQYIETTYRSIINQTLQNFEWLIVDDGATDPETKTLLASLPQRTAKIRVLSHTAYRGVAASYNTAIAQASGKHLCFVDMGGILDPTYLEKCVLFLETHPQVSVVNAYSIVFQAQEHWWHSHLNQPTSLFRQNGVMSHPLYRKTDFDQLGGFDESLHGFAAWERCLKALAQHQNGWTIPEYLDCYRATDETAPTIAHNLTADVQQTIETIHDRYQVLTEPLAAIALEPQPLTLNTLNVRLNVENQLERFNAGKRLLLFCNALDNSDAAKWNCDLVIWLEQCGYDVTIVTTSASDHSCQEFVYRATPDIFHLPNFFDQVHWLAFIRYILASRQIDGVLIAGSEIAYSFLPLLRIEFPSVALIDYSHAHPATEQSDRAVNFSCQFTEDLDCQIVPSQRSAKAYKSFNTTAHTEIQVCYTQAQVEAILTDVIRTHQTVVPASPSVEVETEALLLILESLQRE